MPLNRIPARDTRVLNARLRDDRGGVADPSSAAFLLNSEPPLRGGLAAREAGDDRVRSSDDARDSRMSVTDKRRSSEYALAPGVIGGESVIGIVPTESDGTTGGRSVT